MLRGVLPADVAEVYLAIQADNGLDSLVVGLEVDKCVTSLAIHLNLQDYPVNLEELPQLLVCCIGRQIANVDCICKVVREQVSQYKPMSAAVWRAPLWILLFGDTRHMLAGLAQAIWIDVSGARFVARNGGKYHLNSRDRNGQQ